MKKFFLTLMVAVLALPSFAQQPNGFQFKPEDMATRRADQVKEATKMNDEQYKKVYDLFLKQSKDMQAKMAAGQNGGMQFNREEMQKQQDATNAALKEILGEEMYAAYEKAQKERRQRFGQGGPGGGFGGGQGGGRRRPNNE